ncbi:MAG TPA: branched-chain amino acid ABC transporter ATP-binding protein/permease [Trueperaceae bacterium]
MSGGPDPRGGPGSAVLGAWLRRGLFLAFAVIVVVLPFVSGAFGLRLANLIGMYSLVVLGLVLLTGYAGLASLGQAAFVGTGAYTAAILASRFGLSPWLSIVAGVLASVLIAWLMGLITLRLKGHFLALATLAWGLVITGVLRNWIAVTGGNTGFGSATGNRIPPLTLLGDPIRGDREYYVLVWGALLLTLWLVTNLMRSRVGRAIKSLRTGSVAAASFGVDVQRVKMITFLAAAALAALSGGLHTYRELFIVPNLASLSDSIDYLIMAVIGGLTSVWGALVGTGVFVLLKEQLQQVLPALLGRTGNYEIVAFGFILILVLQYARRGLVPMVDSLLPRRPERPVREDAPPLPARERVRVSGPLLELEGVTRSFGGLTAVHRLSFAVGQGEVVGLIGPNGAGKTTAFNLITGVLSVDAGRVRFAGRDITRLQPHQVAGLGLARTFQHLNLSPSLSLLENVALGAYSRTSSGLWSGLLGLGGAEEERVRAEALRQLRRVGLGDEPFARADSLPLGKLRLLEVARALMADPVLLLLDEPAAGLRRNEKEDLKALVRRLRDEGVTVLLVEHDMDVVMDLVDRIVVMNHGELLAEGTPAVVRRDPAVIEAYLGREVA